MPSPALAKLEQLPKTPLSSQPGSPNRSLPSSRRGSSSASSLRRPSMAAGAAGGASGLASASVNASGSASGSGSNLHALTSIDIQQQQQKAKTQPGTGGEREIAQAVQEEDMGLTNSGVQPPSTTSTSSARTNADNSAIADSSSSSSEEEDENTVEMQRTGHAKLRQGSRRLSRMSSTLGEGATAHWRRPSSSSSSATSTSAAAAGAGGAPSPLSRPAMTAISSTSPPPKEASLPPAVASRKLSPHAQAQGQGQAQGKKLSPIEYAKRMAAFRAVDAHVKPHHRVIGIGSGSTVPYVVERILEMGEKANKRRWFVPTGFQSKELIVNAGLKLGDVDQFPKIDVTIDGADDVDLALNAIKGGGACHLREKVLAEAADEFVIVADYRKNNILLGDGWKQGIPIETPPFAYSKVLENLRRIPGCIEPVLRMGKAKAGPCVTDNGNFVIDAIFDEAHMREPSVLLGKIKMLTGVVECGLFCSMAIAAYFGNEDGKSVTVKWRDGQSEVLMEGQEPSIKRENVDLNKSLRGELLTADLEMDDGQEQQKEAKVDTRTGREELSRKLEELKMTST